MILVVYISGHGFGHASREIELVDTVLAEQPDARVIVRTAVPDRALASATNSGIEFHHVEVDTGIAQLDSLRLDERETARRAAAFYGDFDRRAEEEAGFLDEVRATLVVGDIPPLAFAAAARAGIPSIAIGNFTWDWIYSSYPSFAELAPGAIDTMRRAYANATLAFRLPFHGGFEPLRRVVVDIPLIARRSTRDPAATRRALGIPADRAVVLASFGGYGIDLDFDAIARSQHLTVLAPRREPAGLRYPDLVAAADVVISKPGYGIVSECIANQTPLLYTSRGRFPEYDLFAAGMSRYLRCRFMPQEDLRAGRWAEHVAALLRQPPPPERARVDGASIASAAIRGIQYPIG